MLLSRVTQVTCLSCKHKSNTVEPFWDLSLEFPERYHSVKGSGSSSAYQRSCTLTEMLSKFTEMEALEGNIYACNHCNSESRRHGDTKPIYGVSEWLRVEERTGGTHRFLTAFGS